MRRTRIISCLPRVGSAAACAYSRVEQLGVDPEALRGVSGVEVLPPRTDLAVADLEHAVDVERNRLAGDPHHIKSLSKHRVLVRRDRTDLASRLHPRRHRVLSLDLGARCVSADNDRGTGHVDLPHEVLAHQGAHGPYILRGALGSSEELEHYSLLLKSHSISRRRPGGSIVGPVELA